MRYAIKNKKIITKAYQLGADTDMEKRLIEEGAIRLRKDGRYELFSQEVIRDRAKESLLLPDCPGQIADEGDYIKVDNKDGRHYPYHNLKMWFEENHTHISGNEFEQKNSPLMIWEAGDDMNSEEIAFLLSSDRLSIHPEDEESYFHAKLWETTLTQSKDAVIVIYSVERDSEGHIKNIDFGLVSRTEFDRDWNYA